MQATIDQAKANFTRAHEAMRHALETVPDDRINWAPSPTSRTALHQVAHAAAAVKSIHEMLEGRPFPVPTPDEADKGFREWERQFTTREQVLEILDKHAADYLVWLDALTPDRLDTLVTLPFSLGQAPIGAVLSAEVDHMNWHTAQIQYMQTIYGDHDWHM